MKNTKFTKLAVLLMAVALLIGSAIVITVSAEETETEAPAELSVYEANVVYNDMMYIAFTLQGSAPEGAIAGIVVWNGEQAEYTVENAASSDFSAAQDGERLYYTTPGVAAANIDTVFYFSAAYTLNGEITLVGDVKSYSIAEYAGTRLARDVISRAQANVYANMLNYALASENVITDGDANPFFNYSLVKAVGGYVSKYDVNVGGWSGYDVFLRAEAKNPDDEYFIGWYDEADELVSKNRICTVAAPADGVAIYTAKFGNKADSLYANTVNLEAIVSNTKVYKASPYGFASLSAGSGSSLYLTQDASGDKYFYLDRVSGAGTYVKMAASEEGTVAAEMDMTYTTFNSTGATHTLRVGVVNGSNSTLTLRFGYIKDGNNVSLYAYNSSKSTDRSVYPVNESGEQGYKEIYPDQTITWGIALETTQLESTFTTDEETGETTETKNYQTLIKFYINGEFLGSMNLAEVQDFAAKGWTVADTCRLTGLEFYGLNDSCDDLYFDNFTYFTSNPYEN